MHADYIGSPVISDSPASFQASPHKGIATDNIGTVTQSTFTQLVLEGEGRIVVEFMSYGCGHYAPMEPVLQQVAEMVKSNAKSLRVNIAVERGLADSYHIVGTPTMIMFLNGNEIARVQGPKPAVSTVLTGITQAFDS